MNKFILNCLLISSLSSTSLHSFANNEENTLQPLKDDVEYIVGEGVYFPDDVDLGYLGIADNEFFKEAASFSNSKFVDKDNNTIYVQLGSLEFLNIRDAGFIKVFNDKSLDEINEFYGMDVTYLCFGYKVFEKNNILQCTLTHQNQDIVSSLLSKGLASYDEEKDFNPWQHDLYTELQDRAKAAKVGLWSGSPIITKKGDQSKKGR